MVSVRPCTRVSLAKLIEAKSTYIDHRVPLKIDDEVEFNAADGKAVGKNQESAGENLLLASSKELSIYGKRNARRHIAVIPKTTTGLSPCSCVGSYGTEALAEEMVGVAEVLLEIVNGTVL
jgi:hypothetical protein